MISALLAGLLLTTDIATVAAPTPPPPAAYERPGLTLSLGLGNAYAGLGGQLRYDRLVRPWLHVAPFASVGIFPGGKTWLGPAAGVTTGIGQGHRLVVDVSVSPVLWYPLTLHGTEVDMKAAYGPELDVGYEHVSYSGWVQRLTIGLGAPLWTRGPAGASPPPWAWSVAIGFGRRVW